MIKKKNNCKNNINLAISFLAIEFKEVLHLLLCGKKKRQKEKRNKETIRNKEEKKVRKVFFHIDLIINWNHFKM